MTTAEFDPATANTAEYREDALELARAWADGRRSWTNFGPHEPYTPDVIATMDAQEVVKWAALARVLSSRYGPDQLERYLESQVVAAVVSSFERARTEWESFLDSVPEPKGDEPL